MSGPYNEVALAGGGPESPLIRFAREAAEVHGVSKALASTSFVPSSMQGKPHEVTAAIMAGAEIGMTPMTALRCIDVIEGRPAISANAQRGLALASGCKIEVLESTNTRCRLRGIGPGQDNWTETQWTVDDARRANLEGKKNWQRYPRQMLVARATSDLVRLIAPNVTLGMPYSKEELSDGDVLKAGEATVGAPKMVATRAVQRQTHPPVPDDPTPETSTEPAEPPVPPAGDEPKELEAPPPEEPSPPIDPNRPDSITIRTRAAVMAMFNDLGVTDRALRLQGVSNIVGRKIASVNQLTEDEGRRVVRAMTRHDVPAADYDWQQKAATS